MNIKKLSIFLSVFSLFFLLSFSEVQAADITIDNLSDLPNVNFRNQTEQECGGMSTIRGHVFCDCKVKYTEVATGVVKLDKSLMYCGNIDLTIKSPIGTGDIIPLFNFNINTDQNACNATVYVNAMQGLIASCEPKILKAPDACFCTQNAAYIGSVSKYSIVVNKSLNVLAKDVTVDANGKITAGKAIDASAPEFKADSYTLSTGASDEKLFLSKVLSKKAGFIDFLGGKSCVPADTFWDCSQPVYFETGGAEVCCCKNADCVKKSVFSKGIQACGDGENQVPVPSSGDCKITKEDIAKISGIDMGVLKQRAQTELNPLKFTDIWNLIGRVTAIGVYNFGVLAMIMYIYAGFLWMTASGNSERTGKAKTILIWTTLGVVGILSAYMLVSFVFKSILQL